MDVLPTLNTQYIVYAHIALCTTYTSHMEDRMWMYLLIGETVASLILSNIDIYFNILKRTRTLIAVWLIVIDNCTGYIVTSFAMHLALSVCMI